MWKTGILRPKRNWVVVVGYICLSLMEQAGSL
jgi:hypothetical protein